MAAWSLKNRNEARHTAYWLRIVFTHAYIHVLFFLNFPILLFHTTDHHLLQERGEEEFSFTPYQLVSSLRDGVPSSLSGRKSISFMMLASRTGSSCLRKTNDVFSHALAEPAVTWGVVVVVLLVGCRERETIHNQTLNFNLHSGCATVKWFG